MIKARRNARPDRAGPYGVECLEGRALLSGVTHAAVVATQPVAIATPIIASGPARSGQGQAAAQQSSVTTRPMIALGMVRPGQGQAAAQRAAVAPPMLEESHLLRNGNTVTGLVMTFSKPLDPATAQDLSNYQVYPRTKAAGNGTVSAAVYNPAQDSVTLILARPVTLKPADRGVLFGVHNPYSNGKSESTITDTSGQALQSTGDGQPDGLLSAQFKARGSSPNPLSLASRLARAQEIQHKDSNLGASISKGFDNSASDLIHIRELIPIPFP
jgi:hypothetical protein